ncbi:MAG: malto-oligosyltrehalose trehalohydrolase [Planctomycetota bacterium]
MVSTANMIPESDEVAYIWRRKIKQRSKMCSGDQAMDPARRPVIQAHRSLGAVPVEGKTKFSVWAALAESVVVEIEGAAYPLEKQVSGYHVGEIPGVHPGARYVYRVDGGPPRPDPASRFQPEGVHGPSEVISPEFDWSPGWKAPALADLVIYEMHVGAFTSEGTFEAAAHRLPELKELGITAVELMPVAACAGGWNWGYDGVGLFAPSSAYGTPDQFRRFVDAAHRLGIAVILDVVYNHLGPEGNYLHDFGPYLSSKHQTVWGDAPNFDCPEHGDAVRGWFIANAIYWLDEFRLDGLRVDAIHCMKDDREPHLAIEISDAVTEWATKADRDGWLIAESNVYDPEMTVPTVQGGVGFDAMWSDDFLHSTFAVVRPGEQLCHRKYGAEDLGCVLRQGYVYEGTLREERQRTTRETRVETERLIYSIQNHDFIGNHPLGVRFHQLTSDEAHRAAAALLVLAPAIPMLFMGEEFACEHPFRFFVDFSDPFMRQSVVEGRRREYPQHDWEAGILPTDPTAFESAKIGNADDGNAETRRWYRDLIAMRKQRPISGSSETRSVTDHSDIARGVFAWMYDDGESAVTVVARLVSQEAVEATQPIEFDESPGAGPPFKILLDSASIGAQPTTTDRILLNANQAIVFSSSSRS